MVTFSLVGAAVAVGAAAVGAGVGPAVCVGVVVGDGVAAVEEQPTTSAPMAMNARARATDLFKVWCCLSLWDIRMPALGRPATVARDGLSRAIVRPRNPGARHLLYRSEIIAGIITGQTECSRPAPVVNSRKRADRHRSAVLGREPGGWKARAVDHERGSWPRVGGRCRDASDIQATRAETRQTLGSSTGCGLLAGPETSRALPAGVGDRAGS